MICNRYVVLIIIFIGLIGCSESRKSNKPLIIATSFPVYAMLSEITGDVADVDFIVPSGASPHTYAPKPQDIQKTSKAIALFFVADNFDGWISGVPSDRKIRLIDLVPKDKLVYFSCGHNHSEGEEVNHKREIDPHFWFDPLSVKAITNALADSLSLIYPEGTVKFHENAVKFSKELDQINSDISQIMSNLQEKKVFLHHPSFNYLLNRYGLEYAGSIEESPGKEPSPKFLADLINSIKASGTKAIFSEPQLNTKTAKVIADEANVNLFELNPEGNSATMKNYRDILIFNATVIKKALE